MRAAVALPAGAGRGSIAGFILVGTSMGAVTVIRTAAEEPDVRAVVAEAPYDSYRGTVLHHARLFYGLPEWFPLMPAAIRRGRVEGGLRRRRRGRGGGGPAHDGPAPPDRRRRGPADAGDVVRRVYDAHPGPKQLWVADGRPPQRRRATRRGYWETVLAFLDEQGV